MPKVTFKKDGKVIKEVDTPAGSLLRTVGLQAGLPMNHDALLPNGLMKFVNCHGFGACCTCTVLAAPDEPNLSKKGTLESLSLAKSFSVIGKEEYTRLSCQTRVLGDVTVEINPAFNMFGERFWE